MGAGRSNTRHLLTRAIVKQIPTLIPYSFSQSAEFLVMALGFWYGARLFANGEYNINQLVNRRAERLTRAK